MASGTGTKVIRDITSAEALGGIQGSAQWAVDVLASVEGGVVVVNEDLNIRYCNQAVRDWLGDAETLDELFREARFLGPFGGWPAEIQAVVGQRRCKQLECVPEVSGQKPTTVLSLHCAPLRESGADGIVGAVISIRDCTQRFGLEERLAVSERLAAIGKLAARVAHELNNPLDGILRYVNLAIRLTEKGGDERLRSYLGESRTGLMRMVRIISELLEFSRTSHEQFELTGINDLVEQAVNELTPKIEANRIVVTTDFQQRDMPGVRGARLHQVCGNVLKNAVDAMPDGGRLTITTGLVDADVIIRVSDTGPGLPADTSEVFEPFFTTKKAGEGTGLGLAICKDFIEGMGGSIEAANASDGGAVFTIRIPAERCQRIDSMPVSEVDSDTAPNAVATKAGRND